MTFDLFSSGKEIFETDLQVACFMSEIMSASPKLQDGAHAITSLLEFLPEGPGTGFLQKKRVPGGLLSAPPDGLAKDPGRLFRLRPLAAFCKKGLPGSFSQAED